MEILVALIGMTVSSGINERNKKMIEKMQCCKGHYYDGSVFRECPHCARGIEEIKGTAEEKHMVSRYATEYIRRHCKSSFLEEVVKEEIHPESIYSEDKMTDLLTRPGRMERKQFHTHSEELKYTARKNSGEEEMQDCKTIGVPSNSRKNYFVTGWLVCIEGPDKGHSFNLYYGYNTVGYSRENQVCLMEDASVARKVHCSVVYEDRKNRFFLIPEEEFVTYLNDTQVLQGIELHTGDKIRVGESELEFVAFCREMRKWSREDMRRNNPGR